MITIGSRQVGPGQRAYLIAEMVPSIEKVRMVNSGTEATMSALRLARGFTGKNKMIKFRLEKKEFIPLCALLKATALCQTGGEAKMAIVEELVLVDGQVELRKRCKIVAGQKVEYNQETILVLNEDDE